MLKESRVWQRQRQCVSGRAGRMSKDLSSICSTIGQFEFFLLEIKFFRFTSSLPFFDGYSKFDEEDFDVDCNRIARLWSL